MKEKVIFLVDMQSFYASVEKVYYNIVDKPVLVAGDPERRSGIILAACPLAKKKGVTTAEFLSSALDKCSDAVVVKPHMQRYLDVSIQITKIMERFTDLVEPYSIDEQFMDVTGSQRLFGDKFEIAKKLQHDIYKETGVYARIGIGQNKVLAKLACDNFAKNHPTGIFYLHPSNMHELWKLPVGKMFGIGSKMRRHLERMGIFTIGALAQYPLDILKKRWGVNGEVIWQTANGIDPSPVTTKTHISQKAIGHSMTLPKDYTTKEQIKVVLLELCSEVTRRCRNKGYTGSTVSLGVRGADFTNPTGFYRQIKLHNDVDHDMDVFQAACELLEEFWDGEPIRSIGVTLSHLKKEAVYQLDLFDNRVKKNAINHAIDAIQHKFGTTAIVRAVSLTTAGQAFERSKKIAGHYK